MAADTNSLITILLLIMFLHYRERCTLEISWNFSLYWTIYAENDRWFYVTLV